MAMKKCNSCPVVCLEAATNEDGLCLVCQILNEEAKARCRKDEKGNIFFFSDLGRISFVSAVPSTSLLDLAEGYLILHEDDGGMMEIEKNPDGSGILRCPQAECGRGLPIPASVIERGPTMAGIIRTFGILPEIPTKVVVEETPATTDSEA